jgi:hypothetical protein
MKTGPPTPDRELNAVLQEFVTGIQTVLGPNFIAAYLQGSFAVGDWDADSDVDFLVAMDHDLPASDLPALQSLHALIYDLDCSWAQHLEGSYFPKEILRRLGPVRTPLLYLDNTFRQLDWSDHDNTLVVRWVVREHGIPLAGPDPRVLIDPVFADELRQEILTTMQEWGDEILLGHYIITNRWAQPFVVLSYCRMLQTLQTGRVESKLAGVRWATGAMDHRWAGLIQRAWQERPNPSLKVRQAADPDDVNSTIEFIHYALARSKGQVIPG